jgi:C4-type Zn-finger protein
MSKSQQAAPKIPTCPVCAHAMALKQIHRQVPFDHFIFKCVACALEYPVVASESGQTA